jgi:hypothetical protein
MAGQVAPEPVTYGSPEIYPLSNLCYTPHQKKQTGHSSDCPEKRTCRIVKNLLLIFALAVFWGLSGLLVGLGIRALVGGNWMIQCMALNVITGMLMLLFVTKNEVARKAFYEGVAGDNPRLGLALLWALPFSLLCLGVIWWLLAHFLK